MQNFNFKNLFIYDLANNHQGDLKHGINIIKAIGKVNKDGGVRGAFKFQFRQFDTFIHPDYKDRKDVPHIPRFLGTALSKDQYKELTQAVIDNGMYTICTPFDEESVDLIQELGIAIIKIGSCSAADTPLLERVAAANLPVIASTAGLSMPQIDRMVSFFTNRDIDFALMHCVAIYPTPADKLNLNQIDILKDRFPDVPIGFSTHEAPDNYIPIRLAYAKGAELFERHVGLETAEHKLNKYSSESGQIAKWIDAFQDTVAACGGEHRAPATPDELASLRTLMRGTFAKKSIKKGQKLTRENTFFAMPLHDGQMVSGAWFDGIKADKNYSPNDSISETVANLKLPEKEIVHRIMLQVTGMLNEAKIHIGKDSSIELSHHYGLERFREFGAIIVDIVNREYCKKLIIQLPRQKHPYHYHARKEETFQLLFGDLEVELGGKRINPQPGDTVLVEPGTWHKFHTLDGAIFEEISTTHYNNDSIYEDERIARLSREDRKTVVPNWHSLEAKSGIKSSK